VNDDLKELLRDKADEMRLGQGIPDRVLRRSRRRRVLNTALAGSLVVVLGLGAFAGARAMMNDTPQAHGGPAHQPSITPTPTVTPTPSPSPAGPPAAIVVSEPSSGDTVTSPVHISGTADVFEAVVSIQIVTGNGATVADTTTNASCGSGCRGTYSANVAFSVPKQQAGTILVFERSAKDGSPVNVVRIPVTLEPGGPISETGFDGIWPADDDPQLQQLQADAASGKADWALQPDTTAEKFAADIAHWNPSKISVHSVQPGITAEVELWNTDMAPQWSKDVSLNVQLRKAGDVWIVRHADDGLFDLLTPSIRQDGIVGTSSQQITGQFAQAPVAGWKVTAVLMPAGTGLTGSEIEQTADIPISGNGFDGTVQVPQTHGGDVELIVSVTDSNGNTLGLWARRFLTAP